MRRKDHPCGGCGALIARGKTGLCCHCHPKRLVTAPKWQWTPEWDAMLREAYARCLVGKPTAAIDKLQAITGYPRYMVRLRAHRLGITRDTRRPWLPVEIEFLRSQAGKISTRRIAEQLHRSYESTHCQMQMHALSAALRSGYTITQLSDALGVGQHQVRILLRRGWLSLNEDRRITATSVRVLLMNHLDALDLRLMNQKWLKQELRAILGWIGKSARRAA